MRKQNIPFEEVFDLFAIRIILDTTVEYEKALCWQVYSIVTDYYTPNPDRLRDWISTPKSNGYESLHTTVMAKNGQWVEVQIRSKRMDEIAEKGYAAHWKYKDTQHHRRVQPRKMARPRPRPAGAKQPLGPRTLSTIFAAIFSATRYLFLPPKANSKPCPTGHGAGFCLRDP